ncbi:FG-GAP repeat domain-containing protein [Actinopolymorpha singaporensis]
MGLEPGLPWVEAVGPSGDVVIYDENQQVVSRTSGANMFCVLPGGPGREGWFRILRPTDASTPDHIVYDPDGHYVFASTAEAVQHGSDPWLIPYGHGFGPARYVLANFGVDQSWRVDQHPRFVTDLTGDGRADIIGFGDAGVWTSLNDGAGNFGAAHYVLANLGVDQGWRVDAHPRFAADLTGDGRADIIGFGDAGVWTSLNDGAGNFGAAHYALANLGVDQGWRVDAHPRFAADLTGDGRADIIGFGDAGVWTSLNDGAGNFGDAHYALANFGVDQSWRVDQHPRFVTDLTGDGRADIIGFGDAGVWTSLNDGTGNFGPARYVLDNFGVDQSWRVDQHPRFVTDLTGDGRADIIGFGDAGVWVALNDGAGGFEPAQRLIPFFGTSTTYHQWLVTTTPRLLADLTGNGASDIVGFADDGVWVAVLDTTGPLSPQYVVQNFAYNEGSWRVERHPRVVADLTGDGRGDIVGFGDAGVYVSYNQGSGPVPRPVVVT